MDKDNLPLHIDPYRSAEQGQHLHGTLLIKNMPRLAPMLFSPEGEVVVDLKWGMDEQKINYVKGQFEAPVTLQCQRCLEAFQHVLQGEFLSGLVRNEAQIERLPERFEPLIVQDNTLVIQDMMEDELILSLPIVPMHDSANCKVTLPVKAGDDSESANVSERVNPFKVIESLKSKGNKSSDS